MNYLDNIEDGVRVLRFPGADKPVKWRADCTTCLRLDANPDPKAMLFWPSHTSSKMCRSGSRPHCTCDACF